VGETRAAVARKTLRVAGRRTSVKLEAEFWACLAELAAGRRVPLAALVEAVAAAKPRAGGLASALRVFALRVFALRETRRRLGPAARPALVAIDGDARPGGG
jgi:predicted DNA-binding ribbon-helix-helix protein